ncbi:hypothetical protein Glove_52g4 [Diversispora epigaea]|uniref:Uncharacterized protein n=1 Tax=Diversispora epigaea TaxID=1348612 RepID=A0A397JK48_9GLOM|nr:hypothetical protein Glove_52g4 [Diversispora epigaea]
MPNSRKKLAAKNRLKNQSRNKNSGQFLPQYSDNEESEYNSDSEYSPDSSDEDYNQRILKLGEITFIKPDTTEIKKTKKAPYIGNSTATYYRKYGPSGIFTKAAEGSSSINQYFTQKESNIAIETEEDLEESAESTQDEMNIEIITSNFHLSLHLSACSYDFGPLYAFWYFLFERMNGILG